MSDAYFVVPVAGSGSIEEPHFPKYADTEGIEGYSGTIMDFSDKKWKHLPWHPNQMYVVRFYGTLDALSAVADHQDAFGKQEYSISDFLGVQLKRFNTMTVHMFRCLIGAGPMSINDLETRINDWVQSNAEWENDTVEHTLTKRNTEIDGTGATYYGIDVRFLPENSKDNLQQKFTDKLVNKVDWYRVGYHACTHRDGDGSSGPCSWDDWTEWTAKDVTIPPGVPSFP